MRKSPRPPPTPALVANPLSTAPLAALPRGTAAPLARLTPNRAPVVSALALLLALLILQAPAARSIEARTELGDLMVSASGIVLIARGITAQTAPGDVTVRTAGPVPTSGTDSLGQRTPADDDRVIELRSPIITRAPPLESCLRGEFCLTGEPEGGFEFEPGTVVVINVDGLGEQREKVEVQAYSLDDLVPLVALNGLTLRIRELPGRGNFRVGERSTVILTTNGVLLDSQTVTLVPPETSPNRVIRRSYRLVPTRNDMLLDGNIDLTAFQQFGQFTFLYEPLPNQLVLIQTTEGSFLAPGGGNAAAVGAELDRLANAVAPQDLPEPFETLLAGLGDLERGDPYRDALNQLHAEPYDALLQGSWHAERALVDALWEGCAPGPSGHCAFGAVFGRFLNRAGNPLQADFEETAVGPRGGVSRQLGELAGRSLELRIGAAYEALDLEWRDGARGRGDRLLGGVALHSRSTVGASSGISLDGLDAGLALVGGGGWFETERALNAIGLTEAEAEPEITFLGGHGRVLHRFGAAPRALGWYAELGLEGSAVALWLDAFTEEADTAGALRLRVAETQELYTSVRPQLALGGSWQWGELRLAPRAQLGLNYAVGGADTPYRARFAGAPGGGRFTTRGDSEDLLVEATGAFDLSWGERLSLQLGYAGRVSPDGTTRFHEGQLRAELRF